MNTEWFSRWRANFFTGLAIVAPVVLSIYVVVLIFRNVSNTTDLLLFFLPRKITHIGDTSDVHWYWSLIALLFAILIITGMGRLTRYYLGVKAIEVVDLAFLHIPVLNKIYGTFKQVNEAFASDKKSGFKQVVLVEFPRAGQYAVGFVTGEPAREFHEKTGRRLIGVFVPTTPNPTSGFLIMVPQDSVTNLDMSVADGLKFIISLGSVTPDMTHQLPKAVDNPFK
jgi:uncharacterized membrane protein